MESLHRLTALFLSMGLLISVLPVSTSATSTIPSTTIEENTFDGALVDEEVFVRDLGASAEAYIKKNEPIMLMELTETASGYCGAEGDGTNLSWMLTTDGTLTISGEGPMANYMNEWAPWANYQDSIQTLVISEGVTTIGSDAFYGYTTLTGKLDLPESLIEIGQGAFYECIGLSGDLTIPDGVTVINDYTFYGCTGFDGELNLGGNTESIGYAAFCDCSAINGVLSLPETITYIDEYVFYGMTSLTGELYLPESIIEIGQGAFHMCSGFSGNLVIPDSITEIKDYTFYGCDGLDGNLILGQNTEAIGVSAFCYCSALNGTLNFPETITYIDDYAFYSCAGFNGSLNIPDGVTRIGDGAFAYCDSFNDELYIPASVTKIGNGAFFACSGVNDIYFLGNAPEIVAYSENSGSFDENVCLYFRNNKSGWTDCNEYDADNSVWNGYSLRDWLSSNGFYEFKERFTSSVTEREQSSFPLSSIEDLLNVKNGGSYYLTNDIDLSSFQNGIWTPIDISSSIKIDGQGYCITNLDYSGVISSDTCALGLFGNVDGDVTICNLGVEANTISIEINQESEVNVSGIVGCANGKVFFSNCYFKGGYVFTSTLQSSDYCYINVGGLFNSFLDTEDNVIADCFAALDVETETVFYGAYSVGGIAAASNSSCINCQTNVICSTKTLLGVTFGGIFGSATGNIISNCESKLFAAIQAPSNIYVGGIAGWAEDIPLQCSNADLHCDLTYPQNYLYENLLAVGGLLGYYRTTYNNEIRNCFATGKITAHFDDELSAGGLIGVDYSFENLCIINCYTTCETYAHKTTETIDDIHIGTIMGSTDAASLYSCYFPSGLNIDIRVPDEIEKPNYSIQGTELSEQSNMSSSLFSDWDFKTIWMFSSTETWPQLRDFYEKLPYFQKRNGLMCDFSEPSNAAIPISSAEDLQLMESGKHYYLTNDIDLAEYNDGEWIPLSTWVHLDGQGHCIYNLQISANREVQYAGLFGCVSEPITIQNLRISTSETGVNAVYDERACAGLLIACAEQDITIQNCYVVGNVNCAPNNKLVSSTRRIGYAICGGLVGEGAGLVAIFETQYRGNVSAKGVDAYAGGLVCYADQSKLVNSHFKGAVKAENVYGTYYVEGLSGLAGLIETSYNTTIVNCSSESELMISSEDSRSSLSYGGLVGNSDLLIVKSSYYDGSILVNYDDSGSSGAFGGALADNCSIGFVNDSYCDVDQTVCVMHFYYGYIGEVEEICIFRNTLHNMHAAFVARESFGNTNNPILANIGYLACQSGENRLLQQSCYWNAENTVNGIDETVFTLSMTEQCVSLNRAELSQKKSYIGWDFAKTWILDAALSEHPILQFTMPSQNTGVFVVENPISYAGNYRTFTIEFPSIPTNAYFQFDNQHDPSLWLDAEYCKANPLFQIDTSKIVQVGEQYTFTTSFRIHSEGLESNDYERKVRLVACYDGTETISASTAFTVLPIPDNTAHTIGQRYEQTGSPEANVTEPSINLVTKTSASDGSCILSILDYDCDDSASPFFWWTADNGTFYQIEDDFSKVGFEPDGTCTITVYMGDGLGYVTSYMLTINE